MNPGLLGLEEMFDDGLLRERVRDAVQAGELPNQLPDQLLGGKSTGGRCAICGESTHGDIELELVFADYGLPGRRSYYAHPHCASIFEGEIRRLRGQTVFLANRSPSAD